MLSFDLLLYKHSVILLEYKPHCALRSEAMRIYVFEHRELSSLGEPIPLKTIMFTRGV